MPQMSDAHRAAMRDRLLAAAASVIAARGHAGLTIRDILAEADVAPSTLYAYFGGKSEIVDALIDRALQAQLQMLSESTDQRVDQLFARTVEFALRHPFPARSILAELSERAAGEGREQFVARINEMVVAMTRPFVERMAAAGSLDVSDTDALIELLDIVHDGMTRRASAGSFATSYERVGQVCLELLASTAPPDAKTPGFRAIPQP